MSMIEEMFLSFGLSIVRAPVKNPVHAQTVKTQMLGVADEIYTAYAIKPPKHD